MLRAMGTIRRNPLHYLEQVWRSYGDVVQFPIPRPPSYLVNDPASVRRVLVDNAKNYTKNTIQYRALSLVTGDGLLTADGVRWREHRRLIQPAFHHTTADSLVDTVVRSVREVSESWEVLPAHSVVDIDEFMMHAALQVVGSALFGTNLGADASRLTHATLQALDVVIARARVPITPPAWMPTPANRTLAAAVHELDAAVESMVAARVQDHADDLLGLLLQTTDDTGKGLSTREIRDEMVTFIVAGHETVASALTWSFGFLAMHPEYQQMLADEAEAVWGSHGDEAVTLAMIEQLPVARAIYDETLRLYPPAWLITRSALEGDQLDGIEIPHDALIIMSPYLLHRHEDLWSDAETFRPERFLEKNIPRHGFIPFGAGPRLCIGRDFSYIEAVLLLSLLARDYRWQFPAGGSMPSANPLVTIRPHEPMALAISRRA